MHIERILAGWVTELGVPILYSRGIAGFTPDEAGVDIALANGQSLHAQYLAGWDPTTSSILAEVEMMEMPPYGIHRSSAGLYAFGRSEYEIKGGQIIYQEVGPIGVMVTEPDLGATTEPTLGDLKERLIAPVRDRLWRPQSERGSPGLRTRPDRPRGIAVDGCCSRAMPRTYTHRWAARGLSTGVQDAVNLGWKLARVVKGTSPDVLLDTYHAERHPVGARMLKATMALVALNREDERTVALREIVGGLAKMDGPRKHLAGIMSGLDIRYDLGEGHPLLGRRMPDLDVVTASGTRRVFTFLHQARPVVLNFGAPGAIDIGSWADRVQSVDVATPGDGNCRCWAKSRRQRRC